MAIPTQVQSILDSIKISGIGSPIQPGDRLIPVLDPVGSTVQDLLGALSVSQLLAKIDFVADNMGFRVTKPVNPGGVALDLVMKAVEFAPPLERDASSIQTTQQPIGKLPYTVPVAAPTALPPFQLDLAKNVEGLVGKVTGKIDEATNYAVDLGSLVGNIKGPAVLDALPTIDWKFTVTDAAGSPLAKDSDFVNLGDDKLPIYSFLPEFYEFDGSAEPRFTTRLVSCDITISNIVVGGTAAQTVSRTVGPIPVRVAQLPIPSPVLVTEHVDFHGTAIVTVPTWSPLPDAASALQVLEPLRVVLANVQAVLGLTAVAGFGDTVAAVDAVIQALTAIRAKTAAEQLWFFFKTKEWNATFASNAVGIHCLAAWWLYPWTSGIVVLGPNGRRVDFRVGDFFERRWGALTVTVGSWAAAIVPSLVGPAPAAGPASVPNASTCGVDYKDANNDFNDSIRSWIIS